MLDQSTPIAIPGDDSVLLPVYRYRAIRAYTRVDAEVAERFSQWRWGLSGGYARCRVVGDAGEVWYVSLAREVLGLPWTYDGHQMADHINGNCLDNRRCNLRTVTNAQNSQNKGSWRRSGHPRGVTGQGSHWVAQAGLGGQLHYLGTYATEWDAAKAAARFRYTHMTHTVEDPTLLDGPDPIPLGPTYHRVYTMRQRGPHQVTISPTPAFSR